MPRRRIIRLAGSATAARRRPPRSKMGQGWQRRVMLSHFGWLTFAQRRVLLRFEEARSQQSLGLAADRWQERFLHEHQDRFGGRAKLVARLSFHRLVADRPALLLGAAFSMPMLFGALIGRLLA